MTRAILTRTRTWTLATGLVTAVATGFLLGWDFGAGVLATAIWAVAGFWSLEGLFRSALVAPGTPRNVFAIIIWAFVKLTVYALAVWVLIMRPFPPLSHAVGLTLLLVVLVIQGAIVFPRQAQPPARRGENG